MQLEAGEYEETSDFASDVRLVFENAKTYNRPDSDSKQTLTTSDDVLCSLCHSGCPARSV